jgi:hypothetical protein
MTILNIYSKGLDVNYFFRVKEKERVARWSSEGLRDMKIVREIERKMGKSYKRVRLDSLDRIFCQNGIKAIVSVAH